MANTISITLPYTTSKGESLPVTFEVPTSELQIEDGKVVGGNQDFVKKAAQMAFESRYPNEAGVGPMAPRDKTLQAPGASSVQPVVSKPDSTIAQIRSVMSGKSSTQQPGIRIPIVSPAMESMTRGVQALDPRTGERGISRVSDVIEGGLTAASLFAAPQMGAALGSLRTAPHVLRPLTAGIIGSEAGSLGAGALGADPEQRRLAGNLTGLAAGTGIEASPKTRDIFTGAAKGLWEGISAPTPFRGIPNIPASVATAAAGAMTGHYSGGHGIEGAITGAVIPPVLSSLKGGYTAAKTSPRAWFDRNAFGAGPSYGPQDRPLYGPENKPVYGPSAKPADVPTVAPEQGLQTTPPRPIPPPGFTMPNRGTVEYPPRALPAPAEPIAPQGFQGPMPSPNAVALGELPAAPTTTFTVDPLGNAVPFNANAIQMPGPGPVIGTTPSAPLEPISRVSQPGPVIHSPQLVPKPPVQAPVVTAPTVTAKPVKPPIVVKPPEKVVSIEKPTVAAATDTPALSPEELGKKNVAAVRRDAMEAQNKTEQPKVEPKPDVLEEKPVEHKDNVTEMKAKEEPKAEPEKETPAEDKIEPKEEPKVEPKPEEKPLKPGERPRDEPRADATEVLLGSDKPAKHYFTWEKIYPMAEKMGVTPTAMHRWLGQQFGETTIEPSKHPVRISVKRPQAHAEKAFNNDPERVKAFMKELQSEGAPEPIAKAAEDVITAKEQGTGPAPKPPVKVTSSMIEEATWHRKDGYDANEIAARLGVPKDDLIKQLKIMEEDIGSVHHVRGDFWKPGPKPEVKAPEVKALTDIAGKATEIRKRMAVENVDAPPKVEPTVRPPSGPIKPAVIVRSPKEIELQSKLYKLQDKEVLSDADEAEIKRLHIALESLKKK